MAMQASDLYELVRDLPEVWPEGLKYDPAFVEWWMVDKFRYTYHPAPEQVADLILAGVVRKLWTLRYGCDLSYDAGRYDPTGRYDLTTYTDDQFTDFGADIHSGPTPLHAALAAYRKAKP
jgi:hypothetical protein